MGMGPGMRDGMGPGRMGRGDDDRGYGRRYGDGYGPRGDGYGPRGDGWGRGDGPRRMGALSDSDRQAMLAARLAAAKAALLLTPEQEKLWAPVESAVRDAMK